MAEKKFLTRNGLVEDAVLTEDYQQAPVFDKIRVGKKGVYFRDGLRIRHIDYPSLERVFIRVNQVNARCCCGNTKYDYYRLVFVSGGKEIAEVLSEKEAETDAALKEISVQAPAIAIGTGKS